MTKVKQKLVKIILKKLNKNILNTFCPNVVGRIYVGDTGKIDTNQKHKQHDPMYYLEGKNLN